VSRLPAFSEHVGVEVLQHSNGGDRVHGGAIMTLADTLGAIATVINLPPDTITTTLESKTNFLAAARGAYLLAEATPLHVGRTTMIWQTTIRDAEDRRVEVVTQTQLVLPRPPRT
jgi:uncharacterized protein (TIGR00369 family)